MPETPKEILSRADASGALTLEDQEALAKHAGISVRQLPPSMRGGLVGIFGFHGKDSDTRPLDDDGSR